MVTSALEHEPVARAISAIVCVCSARVSSVSVKTWAVIGRENDGVEPPAEVARVIRVVGIHLPPAAEAPEDSSAPPSLCGALTTRGLSVSFARVPLPFTHSACEPSSSESDEYAGSGSVGWRIV